MPHNTPTLPLDPAIVEIDRRWKAAGIPDLYEGGNGPVSRERARNVRALLYPKPQLPEGRIESRTIPGPAGDITVRVIYPLGDITGTLVYLHGGGFIGCTPGTHRPLTVALANLQEASNSLWNLNLSAWSEEASELAEQVRDFRNKLDIAFTD